MVVAGLCSILWVVVVWRWQDPFTALYTTWKQRGLAAAYEKQVEAFAPELPKAAAAGSAAAGKAAAVDRRRLLAAVAGQYRRSATRGEAIARIKVPRLGLNMILVNGTDTDSLKKGPGRDPRTYMPGEGQLVYIAGHRTTYLAPFANIDKLRPGDRVTLELPYATIVYAITGHRIVRADYMQALKSRGREEIALQACWPRFFATHRYIAYGRPVRVIPRLRALKG
jgi:sortase A